MAEAFIVNQCIHRIFLGLAITAFAAALPISAQAKELPQEFAARKGVTKLMPLRPWNIDFAQNRCILSRLFGEEEAPHLLFLEQAAPLSSFGMTIAGPGLRKFRPGQRTYLGLLNDVPMNVLSGDQRGQVDGIGPAIILSSVGISPSLEEADESKPSRTHAIGIDLGQAAKMDRVVLKVGSSGLSYETGNMMPPLQALNACTDDLMTSWGLNPDEHRQYTPADWLNRDQIVKAIQRDYPRAAQYRGETGIMRMRLIVEADGSVGDCHIEHTTQNTLLKSPACQAMEKARFAPARGADGKAMRSFFATVISYV
ncbi:MAG: TonB family protein [Pseudomonadota bacterium]